MKRQKITRIMKNAANKNCSLCNSKLISFNYRKILNVYMGRELICFNCKSYYYYDKNKPNSNLIIRKIIYNLEDVQIVAHYNCNCFPISKKTNFCITPKCKNPLIFYKLYDYDKKIFIEKKLQFPITKQELEEKISMYMVFQ